VFGFRNKVTLHRCFFLFLSWAPKKGTKETAKGDRGDSSDESRAFASPHKPLSPFGIPLHPPLCRGFTGAKENGLGACKSFGLLKVRFAVFICQLPKTQFLANQSF
jgi:hypothetical protein